MADDSDGKLDETARAVADEWSSSLDLEPTAQRFDPEASIRISDHGAHAENRDLDIADALERLPLLDDDRGGDTFADIEDLGPIGQGGMAEIRAALQVPIGREIATKQVKPSENLGTHNRRSQLYGLLREAWVTGYLEHPNIVPIYRVGVDNDGDPVILMKRVEGVSWMELMGSPARHPSTRNGGDSESTDLRDSLRESGVSSVDIDDTDPLRWHVETLIRVCHAIEFAHARGIVHRDLKPENVMLGEFGEVYVVDWGIAAAYRSLPDNDRIPAVSEVNPSVGTPAFMAPEMIEGDTRNIGPQSDIYLLGGILFNILTGRAPNRGDSILEVLRHIRASGAPDIPEDVPEPLADICRKSLHPNPEERFEHLQAFRERLQDYVRHHESITLSEQAQRRLEELEQIIESDPSREDAPTVEASSDERIRELFAECRFGFEQALELSDTNESARRGLQQILEMMIERELQRDGYEAAVSYLADLPEDRPELETRVEQLGDRLDARDERYEQLQQFRRRFDVDVGRHARSLFVLAIGGLTAMLNLVPAAWPTLTGHSPGPLVTLGTFSVYAAGIAALVYRARHELMKNEANGKMIISFFVVLAADALFRVIQTGVGMERAHIAPLKAVMIGSCFNVLAVALDLRLLWVGITFVAVAGFQTIFPQHVLGLAAGGVILGTLLLARAWWDNDQG